ncbi:hypothetical protein ACFOOM_00745 [Streptomyces echinoruber]|uniref:Uncharacterized protein n=1 Tax=Streptomyces echinoruber TaxID=68898 RepID=A0A918V6N9_9ACTN|nr:hypothetical protein [Streptomyces echinoruber]GGZ73491.1 hypothetical protein GCM10010389_08880 [Streptomyces echinoruber]
MTAAESQASDTAASGQPAVLRRQVLDDALEKARFAARVDAGDDGAALKVTVLSSKAPFDRTVGDATAWLAGAGIEGTAALNDVYDIVLTLRTAASVDRCIAVLLDPYIGAHTAAAHLDDCLKGHGLTGEITVLETHVELALPDDELGSAVTLAALLGAPGIGDDLVLTRRRGLRRLAERLRWLLTGAVGSVVPVTAEPGCAHAPERVTVHLTIGQAHRLAQCLARPAQDTPPAGCSG